VGKIELEKVVRCISGTAQQIDSTKGPFLVRPATISVKDKKPMQTAISTPSLSGTTLKEEAITKLQSRTARVGIIGLGYVGLPLALLFVEEGFRVTGFDIDSSQIDMLASLRSYMCRIP
jgi:glutamate dehydrogenase/leucine dehydrogenase